MYRTPTSHCGLVPDPGAGPDGPALLVGGAPISRKVAAAMGSGCLWLARVVVLQHLPNGAFA